MTKVNEILDRMVSTLCARCLTALLKCNLVRTKIYGVEKYVGASSIREIRTATINLTITAEVLGFSVKLDPSLIGRCS